MMTCTPDVHPTGGPYRLVSRSRNPRFSDGGTQVVRVGAVEFGSDHPVLIAGPCAVENRGQLLAAARAARDAGAELLRGGAFKPRTSPYDFQGLGLTGLELLAEAREETGLPIVTEVLDPRQVEAVGRVADCLQVGARSMQNFALLREVGRFGKPVLLKRHWAASLKEWLCAAEYVAAEGNQQIILCERGIRTFSAGEYNRNTLDLNVIGAARDLTYLPIIVDPSHATGRSDLVVPAARGALAAGADGLIVEIIADTTSADDALCDGDQAIRPAALRELAGLCRAEGVPG